VQAAVDKKIADAKGRGGLFADEYLAGGFRKGEGEHIGYVIFLFGALGYGKHLFRSQKGKR
jgi:hypothetical protein